MLFNSLEFFIFFPIVALLFFATPQKWRWVLLLIASYFFYMSWRAEYIILIIGSTLVDFYCARFIAGSHSQHQKKFFLGISLFLNLGLLFLFKYLDFFGQAANDILAMSGSAFQFNALHLLLPVGISFYTFQTLSYTLDVYRGEKKAETHLGKFALYVSFFPQLVAGPIERSTHLMPQFHRETHFEFDRLMRGLQKCAWGFFKKMVIADRLALIVNPIYDNPSAFSGLSLLFATYAFAFQIYCDFSGYSDIAIGTARILGFDLMKNFNRPYCAKSISEYWNRWHISLTTWFRDYLYYPICFQKRVPIGPEVSLIIVFLVSGLWHGANWTFVVWGALHGVYLFSEIKLKPLFEWLEERLHLEKLVTGIDILKTLVTFHLVLVAWVFFRSSSLETALIVLKGILSFSGTAAAVLNHEEIPIALAAIVIMELGQWIGERVPSKNEFLQSFPMWFRWSFYYIFILITVFFAKTDDQAFIYFQF